MTIKDLIIEAHNNARNKGWWDGGVDNANIPEKLALLHSEISEALEEYRSHQGALRMLGETVVDEFKKPVGFAVELADVVIRLFDLCGALNIDLERAIKVKMTYNQLRPYRHGGKTC